MSQREREAGHVSNITELNVNSVNNTSFVVSTLKTGGIVAQHL